MVTLLAIKIFRNNAVATKSPMPRTVPLPPEEVAICERMMLLREVRNLTRDELCKESKVTPSELTRIELARTPLRYDAAREILAVLQRASIVFLATGEQEMWLEAHIPLPRPEALNVSPKALFSEAVKPYLPALRTLWGPEASAWLPEVWVVSTLEWISWEEKKAQTWLELLEDQHDYMMELRENTKKLGLTNVSVNENTPTVQLTLPKLLQRLRAATEHFGARAELARFLDAKPAQVTTWLSGKREPGGSYTLAMLQWVEAMEAKQKSPGSVDTAARAKTQLRKSSYEKPKSGPPKS